MRTLRLCFIASFATFATQIPESDIRIMRIGEHHEDEVLLADEGHWLALVPGGVDSFLTPTHVSILPVHDELDDDPNSLNGRRVIADITPDPMLLLRGEVFRDGKISTVTSAPLDIPIGEPLTLGPVEFFLQLQDSSLSDGQRQYRFALRLREGEVQQVVATYDGYLGHSQTIVPAAEHFPLLLWAGDLDGDHRIDFVLDTSNHYNVDEVTLFLSSQAPKGALVKAVAMSRRVGC